MRERLWILGIVFGVFLLGRWNAGIPQNKSMEVRSIKAIKTIIPAYPEYLREERVGGEVAISAIIDTKGKIQWCNVVRRLHPDLDRLALEAVKQWTFEPYVYNGGPIAAPTYITLHFYPPFAPLPPKPKDNGTNTLIGDELHPILVRCADYCRKLSDAALFYTCQEAVRESEKKVERMTMVFNWTTLADGSFTRAKYEYPALTVGEQSNYVNDYQLINKGGRIQERRSLLKENGQSVNEKIPPSAPLRVYFAKPILAPLRLLVRERQPSFIFRKANEDKIGGRKVVVIEARPKPGLGEDIREAKIWVDPKNGQILRVVMKTRSVEGCEWILEECAEQFLTPQFVFRHDFGFGKNGILFPSQSEIRIEYSGLVQPPKDTKADVGIQYRNYRFFTVETENAIIR
jgi:TonB family protein